MTKRNEHLFQFSATDIAQAAKSQADYHEKRAEYWETEQANAEQEVKEGAKVVIRRFPQTDGERIEAAVDYGDPTAYNRLQESFQKLVTHRRSAKQFRSDQAMYSTQGDRTYELDTSDVHYYGLHGQA